MPTIAGFIIRDHDMSDIKHAELLLAHRPDSSAALEIRVLQYCGNKFVHQDINTNFVSDDQMVLFPIPDGAAEKIIRCADQVQATGGEAFYHTLHMDRNPAFEREGRIGVNCLTFWTMVMAQHAGVELSNIHPDLTKTYRPCDLIGIAKSDITRPAHLQFGADDIGSGVCAYVTASNIPVVIVDELPYDFRAQPEAIASFLTRELCDHSTDGLGNTIADILLNPARNTLPMTHNRTMFIADKHPHRVAASHPKAGRPRSPMHA